MLNRKLKNTIVFIFALCLCFVLAAPAWATDEIQDTQVRMIDIENELREYLAEYHSDMVFGSYEFIEYASDVLMFNEDKQLAKINNYNDIRYYLGEYFYQLDKNHASIDNSVERITDYIFELSDELKMKTINDIKDDVERKEQTDEQMYQMRNIETLYYNYNASAAAAYGIKYGERLSENYPTHAPYDCTNFVSQAVYAGGINMNIPSSHTNGVTSTTVYWYCLKPSIPVNPWHETTSWINVDDFYSYMIYQVGASKITCNTLDDVQNTARIGDIVQFRNDDGNWHHSIIITGGSKGNLLFSGHSKNRSNYPLAYAAEDNLYRIIRF